MPEQPNDKRRHLVLQGTSEARAFTAYAARGGPSAVVPELDRHQHGTVLRAQLNALRPLAEQARHQQQQIGLEAGLGLQIQFLSVPDTELAFERLAAEGRGKGIELLSVQERDGKVALANVYVPDGQLRHFDALITDYLEARADRRGRPRDRKALINTIGEIRAAAIRGLWTDEAQLLPEDQNVAFWWEVWIRRDANNGAATVADFRRLASLARCEVLEGVVEFPERSVLVMYGSQAHLSRSVLALNCVAELRRAKETAEFFTGLGITEQRQWADDLLGACRT